MGWSAGTVLFDEIIKAAKKAIPDEEERKNFYVPVLNAFLDEDWDTYEECYNIDKAFEDAIDIVMEA